MLALVLLIAMPAICPLLGPGEKPSPVIVNVHPARSEPTLPKVHCVFCGITTLAELPVESVVQLVLLKL